MKSKAFSLKRRKSYPLQFGTVLVVVFISFTIFTTGFQNGPLGGSELSIFITFVGAILGYMYFMHKQHDEDTRVFLGLFEKFNDRYNELNDDLLKISSSEANLPLDHSQRAILIDYFNLCAEEHMLYEAGYVDQLAWTAWSRGMAYYLGVRKIEQLWQEELSSGSYYSFTQHTLNDIKKFNYENQKL